MQMEGLVVKSIYRDGCLLAIKEFLVLQNQILLVILLSLQESTWETR